MNRLLLLLFVLGSPVFAHEIPGGISVKGAASFLPVARISMAPSFRSGVAGAYLTSRLSLEQQPGDTAGVAVGHGSSGFHFGAEGDWEIFTFQRISASVGLAAAYARDSGLGYFNLGASGLFSRPFVSKVGVLAPFAGVQAGPSIGLGAAGTTLAVRSSFGLDWEIPDWDHARFWVQYGVGMGSARSEALLGVSYPFTLL